MSPSSTINASSNHRKENIDRNLRKEKMMCPDTGLETMPFQTTLVSTIMLFLLLCANECIYPKQCKCMCIIRSYFSQLIPLHNTADISNFH